jgi:hypothetical protein
MGEKTDGSTLMFILWVGMAGMIFSFGGASFIVPMEAMLISGDAPGTVPAFEEISFCPKWSK